MTSSDDEAKRLVCELAHTLGFSNATAVLVADRSHTVLRLDAADETRSIIARVAMSFVRSGLGWMRRDVEIARFLAQAEVATTRPSTRIVPGPYEYDELMMSFWAFETLDEGDPNPAEAGAALAAAHHALRSYSQPRVQLWGGFVEAGLVRALARTSAMLTKEEQRLLSRGWDRAERIVDGAAARTASMQTVHGDAHLGKVLATNRGALWTDWEDAFVGPIEFDLACLRSQLELFGEERASTEAICESYAKHASYDRDLVRDLGLVRNVQVIPWLAAFAERRPELLPQMRARLSKLE